MNATMVVLTMSLHADTVPKQGASNEHLAAKPYPEFQLQPKGLLSGQLITKCKPSHYSRTTILTGSGREV